MSTQQELFPTIGSVADETDKQDNPTAVDDAAAAADDERQVQQIESLCMKCYKQVRVMSCVTEFGGLKCFPSCVGRHKTPSYLDTVLQRGYRDVVPMRALRLPKQ